ncbi:hypothetical protein MKW92_015940 [Papaver armeniacum]|nr:hypothetical protein MKW92_015940 [Papaver armeniacum]
MVNLVEWSDHISSSSSSIFSRLQRIKVKFCPKLTTMPTQFPSLKVLEFIVCNGKAVGSLVECNLTSLTSVSIEKCEELVFLPQGLLRENNILQNLEVNNCLNFEGFNSTQGLEEEEEHIQLPPNNSLHTLMMLDQGVLDTYHCPSLCSWPSIHGFNSLSFLVIKGCKRQKSMLIGIETLPKLEYLAIGPFSEDDYFPSLCSLQIDGWSKLKFVYIGFSYSEVLPEWLGNLTSLRECKQGGEESNKLIHIPKVVIVEE